MNEAAGTIILLNGSSSAGKTTLAKKLQQYLALPYQHISLDQFRDGLPESHRRMNAPAGSSGAAGLNVVPIQQANNTVTAIEFGDHGHQMLDGMRQAIRAFAQCGNHVIVDDILFCRGFLADYARAFHGLSAWLIGVRCSLAEVEKREARRQGRFPGTALSHFYQVHEHISADGYNVDYDMEVDTTSADAKSCAQQIIAGMNQSPTSLNRVYEHLKAKYESR